MTDHQSHRRLPRLAGAGRSPAELSPSAAPRIFSRPGSRQAGRGRPASSASARASSHASIIRPAMFPILSMVRACHAAGEGACATILGSSTR